MQLNCIIENFIIHQAGGLIITDEGGQIIYQTKDIDVTPSLERQIKRRAENALQGKQSSDKWEYSNSDAGQFFRVRSSVEEQDGKRFFCSIFTNLSDYAVLYQEISEYSRRISDVSDFQANLLGKMSESYEYCLADICSFFESKEAILYVSLISGLQVARIRYKDGVYEKTKLPVSEKTDELLKTDSMKTADGYICLLSGEAGGRYYSVFVDEARELNEHTASEVPIYNILRLYIENGILRERIIYENEHDYLTGLYNKGKYMEMMENGFFKGCPLAVFNLDVNDLKLTNDTMGHEAGDQLIRIAAKSMLKVSADNVTCFRLGGDEFAMIGKHMTYVQALELKHRWEEALKELNEQEKELHCVIACGLACGETGCSPEKLMEEADVRMYNDKHWLKEHSV